MSIKQAVPGTNVSRDVVLFGQDYDNSVYAPVTLVANGDGTYYLEVKDVGYSSSTSELQDTTTITAAETIIGSEIEISNYNTLTIWVEYTKGDETSYDIIPKFLAVSGGTAYPFCEWSDTVGTKTVTASVFRMTVSGYYYFSLNIEGLDYLEIYGDATGGSPTGTSKIRYTLTNK